MDKDAQFFLRHAARCRHLTRDTSDEPTRQALLAMADEDDMRARQLAGGSTHHWLPVGNG